MNGVPYSALMLLVGQQERHLACKKSEWLGAGVVMCLERDADLHMAQLYCLGDMPSVYGNADAAVEARIIIVWNKFRHTTMLDFRDIGLNMGHKTEINK